MLTNTNLTSNRNFKIKNFEEDKIAVLNRNPGLHFEGKKDRMYIFSGSYYLKDDEGKLIKSFNIKIILQKNYPNVVPMVFSNGDEIEKVDDNHISKEGLICFEHDYQLNKIASGGLRLFDFIEYYFPKYFSWVLLKQNGKNEKLVEWAHQVEGTLEFYQTILKTNDSQIIIRFITEYLSVTKPSRNHECYCGSGKKLKNCHLEAVHKIRATSKNELRDDFQKIKKVK